MMMNTKWTQWVESADRMMWTCFIITKTVVVASGRLLSAHWCVYLCCAGFAPVDRRQQINQIFMQTHMHALQPVLRPYLPRSKWHRDYMNGVNQVIRVNLDHSSSTSKGDWCTQYWPPFVIQIQYEFCSITYGSIMDCVQQTFSRVRDSGATLYDSRTCMRSVHRNGVEMWGRHSLQLLES